MLLVLLAFSVSCSGLIIYQLCKMFYTLYFSPLLKIPGLPYGPLYGNLAEAMQGEAMDSSVRWVKKYGGVVRFYHWFGSERILVADADAIHYILVTNSRNYKRSSSSATRLLVGEGLLGLEGEAHRGERKLLNPAMNLSAIKCLMAEFCGKAEEMVNQLTHQIGNGKADTAVKVNVQLLVKSATMDVIGKAAFCHDFGAVSNPQNERVQSISCLVSAQQMSLLSSLPFARDWLPIPANRTLWRATKIVNDLCQSIIKQKRQEPAHSESNILSRLLQARYEETNERLSDRKLIDHMVTFMIAGHETTSWALTWLLLELARNPDVQGTLQQEVDQAFPTSEHLRSTSWESIDKLVFLDACVKEVLRLYPPASSLLRVAEKCDTLRGYEIPAGTTIVLHLGAMMRTVYKDGEVFKPSRFLTGEVSASQWLPFGMGPHACIGRKFALLEMKLFLCFLMKQINFSLVPGLKIRRKYRLLLRPEPDVELIIRRRSGV